MLSKRVMSAIIGLPILFLSVLISLRIFYIALCIITVIGLYEYFCAVDRASSKPMKYMGILSGLLLLLLIMDKTNHHLIAPFITLIIFILLAIPVFNRMYNFTGAGITIVGIFYVPLFFGYLYLIRAIPATGVYLIWFVFIISFLSDTFAYFIGRSFGKTKLCPKVSPKKTVEGAVGGIVASTIGCTVYGMVLNSYSITGIPIVHLILMGIIGSIISIIGDLAASSIKRNVGVKDYGNIMPGHGGVLDRFDSILFVAPLIYYYITYVL